MWEGRIAIAGFLRTVEKGRVSAPVDAATTHPEVTSASSELADGGCNSGSAEPVDGDSPVRGFRGYKSEPDNLPAAAGASEAGPFAKASRLRDQQGAVIDRVGTRELGTKVGEKASGGVAAETVEETQDLVCQTVAARHEALHKAHR